MIFFPFKYVDYWEKIVLFRNRHPQNSTTELIFIHRYMYILTSAITKQTGCMKIHLEYFFQYPFREKNNGKCKKKSASKKKEYLTS